eukprot:996460-Rhodomonas_salina.1
MLNFYDAVEAVMSIHGVDPTEANAAYAAYLAVEDDHSPGPEFNVVSCPVADLRRCYEGTGIRAWSTACGAERLRG